MFCNVFEKLRTEKFNKANCQCFNASWVSTTSRGSKSHVLIEALEVYGKCFNALEQ